MYGFLCGWAGSELALGTGDAGFLHRGWVDFRVHPGCILEDAVVNLGAGVAQHIMPEFCGCNFSVGDIEGEYGCNV